MTYATSRNRQLGGQRRNRDHPVAAFHCVCGWWHVGTPSKKKARR